MGKINCLIIDALKRDVYEVAFVFDDTGSMLHSMYEILKCDHVNVNTMALEFMGVDADLWYDSDSDSSTEDKHGFILEGLFVSGNGLIAGCDVFGNTIDHPFTRKDIDTIKKRISFVG